MLKDDTGMAVFVLDNNENASEICKLPCESFLMLRGVVNGDILNISEYKVLHKPRSPGNICVDMLPEDPLEYVANYHIYVRHPAMIRIIKMSSHVMNHSRGFLLNKGFIELSSPIIGHVSDPGLRGAVKATTTLYGRTYELQSSVIMYKQLYASILGKIFYMARNIRVEPIENVNTGRHLVEFVQLDVEKALSDKNEMIKLGEELFYTLVKRILENHLELLDQDRVKQLEKELVKPPYPRLTYDEAVEIAVKMGFHVKHGQELSFEAEAAIADKFGSPIWILGFPTRSRGFYYLPDPDKDGYNVDYNLLLPGGHGEVLDGGCREYRYEKVLERLRESGEDLSKYKWFLQLLEAGVILPTCGWGFGIERFIKYLYNLKHIAYATPHPRIPGIIGP
ncbi:MAG: asparagine synthetase A [Desulfurococcaceae archaeon]